MYYLVSKATQKFIFLGKKVDLIDRKYEGPMIWVEDTFYYLPHKLLNDVMLFFSSLYEDTCLIQENELMNFIEYDEGIEIGGDADNDIDLEDFFTILQDSKSKKEIIEANITSLEDIVSKNN